MLYGILAVVSLGALGVLHAWRMDLATAKAKADAQDQIIAAVDKRAADRDKQFEAQISLINSLRVTPKTPPAVIITRLQGLEPSMNVLPDQLVAPKPDAPKENLVLDRAQQVTLVNRLDDCKLCDTERAKLKSDLVDSGDKYKAMTKERDDWKTAAKGGSLWTRFKRRARAFGEDAVIIELARCAAGHC
jgi:hypothetical protein